MGVPGGQRPTLRLEPLRRPLVEFKDRIHDRKGLVASSKDPLGSKSPCRSCVKINHVQHSGAARRYIFTAICRCSLCEVQPQQST